MTFFQDEQGHPHGPRVAGVFYVVALIWSCGPATLPAMCLPRLSFALGWWMAFCNKPLTRTLPELIRRPFNVIGLGLVAGGIIAQSGLTPGQASTGSILLVGLVGIFALSAGQLYRKYFK